MRAVKANGVPVTYLLFADEGHVFSRPNNAIASSALLEEFLARDDCLGGRSEPIGDDLDNSSGVIVDDP